MARQLGSAALAQTNETGFPPIGGSDAALLTFPGFAAGEALRLAPQASATDPIASWAVGLDLFIPQPAGSFVSLLQTGDGDGELFLRDNGDGTAGIGIGGVYDGSVPFDAWTRIIATFTQEGDSTVLRKYVDGELVGEQDLGATSRWNIAPEVGLKLFNDDDGETAPGAVSSVFFSSEVPSAAEVAALVATIPTANAAGFFPSAPSQGAVEINFENEDVAPRYGAAAVFLDGFGFQTPAVVNDSRIGLASQLEIVGPGGVDTPVLDYAAYTPAEGILVGVPPIAGDLASYTAVWDINVDGLAGFQALLQTDVDQADDGELFLRADGGIGINGDYDGTVTPETWHRIAITVEDQGDGTSILSKYLDGAFLDSQTVSSDRFVLPAATGFLLLTDDDNETGTGHLAHFGLSEQVLDEAAVAALGSADGDGPFTATPGGPPAALPPSAAPTRSLTLTFDSSFRPYDDMTGEVLVSLDGGPFQSLLTLDTASVPGGTSSLSRVDETVPIEFEVPAATREVAFSFNLRDAGNDWWWAIDNIALTEADGGLLFAENFNGRTDSLQPALDENIPADTLGWTATPPDGWTRENDPNMPQGTAEWQGWSFATPAFWTSADGQNRSDFTKGAGVVAIADPDEWDDFNTGSLDGSDFASTLTTPTIPLSSPTSPATYQLGFDGYRETAEFGFEVADLRDEAADEPVQDNIDDLLLPDDGSAVEIDLRAAFGDGATDFMVDAADGAVVDAQITGTTLNLSGLALGHSDISVTARRVDGAPLEENFRAIVAGENAYVFAVIPDTQDYTSNPGIAATFGNMTDWLLAQKDSLAIQHAIHVGDIVQFGAESQWQIAEDAMERLDGELSYTLAIGNHDQQRPGFASAFSFETDVDAYFTLEQVGATAAQGGGTYDGFDVGADTFDNGDTYADSIRNHYTTLTTPDGTDWLILSLEFGMPDDVLRWASEVIEDHLDHRVIIDTHSWNGGDGRITPTNEPLTTDNGGWGYAIRDNPRGVNDGEDAWRELASKYPNVTFTFNGHNFMGGAQTVVSYAAGGNPVHQVFVNYQNGAWAGPEGIGPNGGNGALRLMVIDPDNDRITTHTKLVELDTYFDAFPDHQEVFEGVDLGTPEQIAIAKAGETVVVAGDGTRATVSLDPSATMGDTTNARFEWFAADGEKLGETDGAPLSTELATGTNRLVLQVTDRNGNVSTAETAVIVEAPAALLTETFDDGDAAGWGAPASDPADPFALGTDLGFSLPSIGGVEQIPLGLQFASSFRPYDAMTGEVLVSFDEGESFATLLTLDAATVPGGQSSLARANETVMLEALAPNSASNVQFAWRLSQADNDWWWAIDDITLTGERNDDPTVLLSENFDDLPLQDVVDEATPDPDRPVWTPTPPAGWAQEVASTTSPGATEFQGWTFMEQAFWVATAGNQSRDTFALADGTIAVADPDEWDDVNQGAAGNTDEFDSTLATPLIDLTPVGGGQPAGEPAGIVGIDPLAGDEGLLLTPAATGEITDYTLVFDILPSETTATFSSLYQTDVTNADDAELYLRNDGAAASIGILGDYDGALGYGEWGRLALVVETDEAGQQTLSTYLDGAFLDSQVVDADVSDGSRWTIDGDAGFLLFSEPNGFTSEQFVNALHFTPEVLDAATIAALGGVDVDGPVDAPAHADAFQFNFDTAIDGLDYGAATLETVSFGDPGASSYLVKGSIFGNPDGEGEAALYQQSNGANELLLWQGEGATAWTDYAFDVVVEPADNDTVGAVFYYQDDRNYYQLSLDQQNDTRTLIKVADGVETVLATETGSYRHFAMQDLRIAVLDGEITITLDDELLFGGPVIDAEPLGGGTVGVLAQFMDRVLFDDISVNPIELAARALASEPGGRWAVDRDGDGHATVALSAAASLSKAGISGYEWLVDGAVAATGETAALDLAPGETTVVLRVTDTDGTTATDPITVTVAPEAAILAADGFEDGDFAGWTVVDEGTIDGPSDWQVVGGELVQATDIRSTQQGLGSTAFSVAGDGPYLLRDGTYVLWNDPAALDWTDYALEATLTPDDDDGIGLLFRYTDPDNYYKLEADAETGLVMLTRHLDGRETILARAYGEYTPGEAQDWRVEVEAGVIRSYIDGKAVFGTPVEDRTLPTGTVGLYGWGSQELAFDDVVVTRLGALPETVDDDRRTVALLDPRPAQERLNILLVNDDGFDASGLAAMRDALLEADHRVTVVAPLEQQSGNGTAIDTARLLQPIAVTEFRPGDFNVDGTPATTTIAALDFILDGDAPDLVVSGINEGANIGDIAVSSGTVSAAVTALLRGVPSVAVSANGGEVEEEQAADLTTAIVEDLAARAETGDSLLPDGAGLNVNVPAGWNGEDVAYTVIGGRSGFDFVFPSVPGGDVVYGVELGTPSGPPESDAAAIAAGAAAITVIDGDWTAAAEAELLEARLSDLSFTDPSAAGDALRILLTSADGFDAPGVETLAAALHEAGHEVTIVTTAEDLSGAGTDLSVEQIGQVVDVVEVAADGATVASTPVVVTGVATQALLDTPPDLVVAGINAGENVGRSAIHSGEIAAALTGVASGVPGIAVSAGIDLAAGGTVRPETYDVAAALTVDLVADLIATRDGGGLLSDGTALSVNVPSAATIAGIAFTELDEVTPRDLTFGALPSSDGAGLLPEFDAAPNDAPRSEGSNFVDGFITITPLDGNYTADAATRDAVEAQITGGEAYRQVLAGDGPFVAGDFLGTVEIPSFTDFAGTTIGGLSGLTFDPATGTYLAVSDDRGAGDDGTPRFYEVAIDLADGRLDEGDVSVLGVTALTRADGSTLDALSPDPEGIALGPAGELFISSERDLDGNPAVYRFDAAGVLQDQLPVDAKFLPDDAGTRGVRDNLGFESLTLTPDRTTLYTATESALVQDGRPSTVETGAAARIVEYDLTTGESVAEYVYEVDPIATPPMPEGAFADSGLVELLAVDNQGTLLALERSFSIGAPDRGYTGQLFLVRTQGATDVEGTAALPTAIDAGELEINVDEIVSKELLLDLGDLGIAVDNVEGMAFGPVLEDGRQSLIIVSDDNFSAFGPQATQFTALALDLETIPTVSPTLETPDELRFPATDPIVIGHRGASGELPEHTLGAYARAIADGADFIEPDLVSTADGVLIARHEPWLATVETDADGEVVRDADGNPIVTFASTDVATRPEFADRLTTKNIGFNNDAFGFDSVTGWFAEDFTLEEIKSLRAVEDQPELRPQAALYDGLFEIPTLDEIIDLVQAHEARTGAEIGIYPETKEPSYFDSIGLSLEEKLIDTLVDQGFTDPDRVFIQSFEVANLLDLQENVMPAAGIDLPLVQLLFNAPAFPTYDLLEEAVTGGDFSRYASLGFDASTVSGDLFTPAGLAALGEVYAEGVGPSFSLIVDGSDGSETSLVADARAADLLVHGYTHADERAFLTEDGREVTGEEAYARLLDTGVDGIFTDHPATGRAATDRFVVEEGPDPDDPAIWLHPTDGDASVVVTAMKNDGLRVYDLAGNELQRVTPPDIRYNNVDVLYGVELAGEDVDLAVVSDRANDTLAVFAVDAETGRLSDVTAAGLEAPDFSIFGVDDGEATAYGLATYRSTIDGRLYAFTTQADGSRIAQLELTDTGDGTVAAEVVRRIELPVPEGRDPEDFQSEGIAVDRETGTVYVAVEEEIGLVRFGAEPTDPAEVEVIADIDEPFFTPDLEGVSILYGRDGAGALVVSSQGDASFAVFDRESYAYLGSFAIGPDGAIDGVEESDGLDIFAAALGGSFPNGLLVTQDGSNEPQVVQGDPDDGEIQNFNVNFKLTDLADVVARVDVPSPDAQFDPRAEVRAGSADADLLRASAAEPQILLGGSGNDRLLGGDGFAVLRGGEGRDTLQAGAGGARLVGDGDRDLLIGGDGPDTFVLDGDGPDILRGFDPDLDVVELAIAGVAGVDLRDVGRHQVLAVDTGTGPEDVATILGGGVEPDAVVDPFVG